VLKSLRGARVATAAGAVAAAVATVLLAGSPAMAAGPSADGDMTIQTTDSNSWNLPGGDKWEVNAWHCGTYVNACDWKTSTKLLGNNPGNAWNITNRAELEAHGISASIEISKEPKASLSMKSRSLGEVRWTNTNAWIADLSGQMKPSYSTAHVSTRSCGSGQVNANINVSEKCVYAGAF
jgi:hypothetical protein